MSSVKIGPHGPVTEFMSDLDACEGKTIKSIHDERLYFTDFKVIRFTDGSAIALREMEDGSYTGSGEKFEGRLDLRYRVYFGMADAAAYQAQEEAERESRRAASEASERAQYEALKAKFGN